MQAWARRWRRSLRSGSPSSPTPASPATWSTWVPSRPRWWGSRPVRSSPSCRRWYWAASGHGRPRRSQNQRRYRWMPVQVNLTMTGAGSPYEPRVHASSNRLIGAFRRRWSLPASARGAPGAQLPVHSARPVEACAGPRTWPCWPGPAWPRPASSPRTAPTAGPSRRFASTNSARPLGATASWPAKPCSTRPLDHRRLRAAPSGRPRRSGNCRICWWPRSPPPPWLGQIPAGEALRPRVRNRGRRSRPMRVARAALRRTVIVERQRVAASAR